MWEYLKDSKPFNELLDRVPDEFYQWVDNTKNNLLARYEAIEEDALDAYARVKRFPTRKEQAFAIKDFPYKAVVFKMLDQQPYAELIWKFIKPAYEKPFKEDEA